MKNEKTTPYTSPELEIVSFECSDILTASGGGNGYVSDDNTLDNW